MDVSSTTDANNELNQEKEKAEEEKCLLVEKLAKTKAEYEQALKDKNCKITSEIECIKKNMEDQMCKEREQAAKASKHQLKTIMSELCVLKEKQEKDFTCQGITQIHQLLSRPRPSHKADSCSH